MAKNFSWFSVLLIALTASLGALYIDHQYFSVSSSYQSMGEIQKDWFKKYGNDSLPAFSANVNFVAAAKKVKNAVVYIKVRGRSETSDLKQFHQQVPGFEEWLELPDFQREGSGSGVILSDDGLIVTNNHVIENAAEVTVVLNNKQEFEARILGKDPSTDLGLIKIEAKNLPIIGLGNSDEIEIGEWVLAIGNPFDLTSTVTAGIISGKARSINILREKSQLAIESFIQTDAAVNPGNSGGALVNLRGELVGINTAIASPTGSYSGYSFAVPVNLVKKVVDDLLQFGAVQRGLLGISIIDISDKLAKANHLESLNGVMVREVGENSAAKMAGIQSKDIILKINKQPVNSVSELQEIVGRYRPGDKIELRINRSGKEIAVSAILKGESGEATSFKSKENTTYFIEEIGLEIRPFRQGNREGLLITDIRNEALINQGLKKGYILLKMDKKPVKSVQDCQLQIQLAEGAILLECADQKGTIRYFAWAKKPSF